MSYHEDFRPAPGIKVTYYDAGHILGSGSLRLEVTEDDKTTSIIFSGDIGRPQALIVRDPESPPKADYIFMESTYGDRNHKNEDISDQELADAIAYSYSKGEKVIIPAFAVERTQEILYCLHILQSKGKLPADMPVFVDSPWPSGPPRSSAATASSSTRTRRRCSIRATTPSSCPTCAIPWMPRNPRASTNTKGPAIIISASGMLQRGPRAPSPQAQYLEARGEHRLRGVPGRGHPRPQDRGKKPARSPLFGEDMEIAARIYTINGFSAHAGQDQLLSWLEPLVHDKANVVLVHGEEKAQSVLAGLIGGKVRCDPLVPGYMEEMILEGHQVAQTVQHEALAHPASTGTSSPAKWNASGGMFKGKLADIEQSPWVQQTELQDALAKMDYALTRLLSRM